MNIKTSLGAICAGLFLSMLLFYSMYNHFQFSFNHSAYVGLICVLLFCGGLIYSPNLQCFFLLALPIFFTKRGRTMLIAYVLVISVSGPLMNTTRNTEVLMKSLACDQRVIGKIAKEIALIIKRPLVVIKRVTVRLLRRIKRIFVKMRNMMMRMEKCIISIVATIKRAVAFLAHAANICNKENGSPFARCVQLFQVAHLDCQEKLGFAEVLCEVTHLVKSVCYSVKIVDYLCEFVEYVSDNALEEILRNLKEFQREIHDMMYVSIKFKHHFEFHTNASKTFKQIRDDIVQEVREKAGAFFWLMSAMHCISGVMFIWVLVRVYYYKSKFMSSDRFDNVYLNSHLIALDRRRSELGMDCVLPLTWSERTKYIYINSWRLTRSERLRIIRSASFLLTTTLHIAGIIGIDFSLHWLLATIRYYSLKQSGIETPPAFTFHIVGQGLIAELIHAIIFAFSPLVDKMHIDPKPCLPLPSPPNYFRYAEIVSLLSLAYFMLIFEPYGLRLRQVVMNTYHPDRSRDRAAWLLQQILRKRSIFVKFARRQLRRKWFKDGGKQAHERAEKVTWMDMVRAKLNHLWIFRQIFGSGNESFCMLCGSSIRRPDEIMRCVQPNCAGKYCATCFRDLQRTCPICMKPVEYGDLSDISEVVDSSDGELIDIPAGYVFIDSETGKRCGFQAVPVESDSYRRWKYF